MCQQELEGDTFVCPDCGGIVPLSSGSEDALLESGCVYCGADLSVASLRCRG